MLNRKQKETIVDALSQELEQSTTVVVCDYKGLTVANLGEVRKSLREKQAKMRVVKKTLANLALSKIGTELDPRKMEGQVAIVFGGEDEICTPKILADYAKKNKSFRILAGLLEKKALNDQEVLNLASLPSKQEMLGRLVGTINAPISGFVNVLAGNLRGLVNVLNAIKETK